MFPADLENMFFSPQSQSVIKGQDVFFQCVSGDSSPPAHISWLKNSRAFTKGTQIQVLKITVLLKTHRESKLSFSFSV